MSRGSESEIERLRTEGERTRERGGRAREGGRFFWPRSSPGRIASRRPVAEESASRFAESLPSLSAVPH